MPQNMVTKEKSKKDLFVILFLSLKKTVKPSMPVAATAMPTVNISRFDIKLFTPYILSPYDLRG